MKRSHNTVMKVSDASTVAAEQDTWTRCRSCTDNLDIVQRWAINKKKRKAEHSFINDLRS